MVDARRRAGGGGVHRGGAGLHGRRWARAPSTALGTDDGVSWWASGAPLLAWEPGVGWARGPLRRRLAARRPTSPAADVTLRVSAPERADRADDRRPGPRRRRRRSGRRTWTSAEPVARDVSVAVGEFTTAERTTPGGVRVTAGVLPGRRRCRPSSSPTGPVEAIADLEQRLGPFPYGTLTVAAAARLRRRHRVPELDPPGHARAGTVLVHEVAHMWFYGMVGNSQFRDPWLDEAFATYAEDDGEPAVGRGARRAARACPATSAELDGRLRRRRDRPLLRHRLRQGRRRAAGRPRGRRRRGVRRGDPLLRRRQRLDHRHARRTSAPPSPTSPRRSPSSPQAGALDPDDVPAPELLGGAQEPLQPADALDQVVVARARRTSAGSPGSRTPHPGTTATSASSRISSASSALLSAVRPAIGRPSRPLTDG